MPNIFYNLAFKKPTVDALISLYQKQTLKGEKENASHLTKVKSLCFLYLSSFIVVASHQSKSLADKVKS